MYKSHFSKNLSWIILFVADDIHHRNQIIHQPNKIAVITGKLRNDL